MSDQTLIGLLFNSSVVLRIACLIVFEFSQFYNFAIQNFHNFTTLQFHSTKISQFILLCLYNLEYFEIRRQSMKQIQSNVDAPINVEDDMDPRTLTPLNRSRNRKAERKKNGVISKSPAPKVIFSSRFIYFSVPMPRPRVPSVMQCYQRIKFCKFLKPYARFKSWLYLRLI